MPNCAMARGHGKQRYSDFTQRIEALGIAFSSMFLAKAHNLALSQVGKEVGFRLVV